MAKNKVVNKTRRANGEGSIFQRKDGRWTGYVTLGYKKDGSPIRKFAYGKSKSEVIKKLSEINNKIRNNTYELIENNNLEELMLDWLLTFKKCAVTPRTFEGCIRNFNLHIKPIIGKMKVDEIDNYSIQRVINKMVQENYSNNTIKKNKHLLSQFFEYAIDNNWIQINPTNKIKIAKEKKLYEGKEKYKALPIEIRNQFLNALSKDESNFIKPLCITMMFAGLRIGEALALTWSCINFENKKIKVLRAITQVPKFDENGNIISRITVVGDTKTTCSVREIPVADIVIETLKEWYEKQIIRQRTNKEITADLTAKSSYVFANDDGSVRTYSGTRKIFDRFKRRNNLHKSNIHFHGLRHTFSNMLFEMNENPKVIQQLLGHRDVKTTITVYNSVDNEYIRQTTEKFNEKVKEDQLIHEQKKREDVLEERKDKFIKDMSDDEFDDMLQQLMEERKERKRKREKDFEM